MKSEKLNRKELVEVNEQYLVNWRKDGGRVTTYICGHCKKSIRTPQPKKADCGPKGFWDSLELCTECGKLNFVAVYPSGKTEVKKL